MYKLLIADDEEIERRALRMFIYNSIPEISKITEVENGLELIEVASKEHFDIMVIDINMPGLNGLEAIKILRIKECTAKIIVYTAHSEFEYAREALEYRVDDYFLKPAKREKFITVVKKCITQIESQNQIKEKSENLEKMIEQISPIIRSEFMTSIILNDSNIERLKIYASIAGIIQSSGFIMTFSIPTHATNMGEYQLLSKAITRKNIIDTIAIQLENLCKGITGQVINDRLACFIPIEKGMGGYRLKVWSIEVAEIIIKKTFQLQGVYVTAGIGGSYNLLEEMNTSYRESLTALNDQSIKSSIKHYYDLVDTTNSLNPFTQYENDFIKFIKQDDVTACKTLVERVFKRINREYEIEKMRDYALETMIIVMRGISNRMGTFTFKSISITVICGSNINVETYEGLKEWILGIIYALTSELNTLSEQRINSFVNAAVDYIKDNYMLDISLDTVAEKAGISSYYLSRLFKQEAGKNFVDYINDMRIEKAKELLSKYQYSIKEVAEKVGYNSPTYFCKVFKRLTGKTVGEYKTNLSSV